MEIKDKPESMSVREWITKKVALSSSIPENVIRHIISHQFDSAYNALNDNNSIEISGFGKFYYNKKKAETELKYYEDEKTAYEAQLISNETTEKERHKIEKQLRWIEGHLKYLNNKNGTV